GALPPMLQHVRSLGSLRALMGTARAPGGRPRRDPRGRVRRPWLERAGPPPLRAPAGPGWPERGRDRLLRRDAGVHGRLGADAAGGAAAPPGWRPRPPHHKDASVAE